MQEQITYTVGVIVIVVSFQVLRIPMPLTFVCIFLWWFGLPNFLHKLNGRA